MSKKTPKNSLKKSKPPQVHQDFISRFPKLGQAWKAIAEEGQEGSLDDKTQRLIKFGIAIGAGQSGASHASVRKARDLGIAKKDLEQVVALATGTIGMPAAVAAFSWIQDEFLEKIKKSKKD